MPTDPLKEQAATVGAFGRSASDSLMALGSKLPKPKQIDTSKWGNLSSLMFRGLRPGSGPVDSSISTGITDAGADTRSIGPTTTTFGGHTHGEGYHPGIDVAAPMGTKLPSLRSGTVTLVSTGHVQGEPKSYGNRVGIKDANGYTWYYSHLDRSWVKMGQHVAAGEGIGTIGNTGSTYSEHGGTGSHLDLRIVDAYNKFVDPRYLNIRY